MLDALVALLNRRVHPVVPRFGSIGAADLPQLSHLALPLIGEGEAELAGERLPGAVALARAGLTPVALAGKDGLALVSANAAENARRAAAAASFAIARSCCSGWRRSPPRSARTWSSTA